jgi:hypothetical protein
LYRLSERLGYRISRINELWLDCKRRSLGRVASEVGGEVCYQTRSILRQYIKISANCDSGQDVIAKNILRREPAMSPSNNQGQL